MGSVLGSHEMVRQVQLPRRRAQENKGVHSQIPETGGRLLHMEPHGRHEGGKEAEVAGEGRA